MNEQYLEEFIESNDSAINNDSLELAHHGILGMKWGKQNGPPYPLGAEDHSKQQMAMAEATGTTLGKSSGKGSAEKLSFSEKRKLKKLNKQRKENLEKARAAKEAKANSEKERKAALASGDANRIKAVADRSSTQELQEAVNRMNLYAQINSKTTSEPTAMDKIDKAVKTAATVSNWVSTGTGIYNNFARIHNSLSDGDDLPLIGQDNSKNKSAADKLKAKKEAARKKKIGKLLQSNDVSEYLKSAKEMTTDEMEQATKRLNNVNRWEQLAGKGNSSSSNSNKGSSSSNNSSSGSSNSSNSNRGSSNSSSSSSGSNSSSNSNKGSSNSNSSSGSSSRSSNSNSSSSGSSNSSSWWTGSNSSNSSSSSTATTTALSVVGNNSYSSYNDGNTIDLDYDSATGRWRYGG